MGKHRRFAAEFKAEAVRRMQAGECVSKLSRELEVRRKLLYAWREAVEQGRPLLGPGRRKRQPGESERRVADRTATRIQELERLVGQLTFENRFFRGALRRIEEQRLPQGATGETPSSSKSKR